MLRYWLDNEFNPTWEKICDALRRIKGYGRLLHRLRMKYCSLRTCQQCVCKVADADEVAACEVDCNVQGTIERLQRDFRQRVTKIRSSFGAVSVTAIKDLLKELPAGEVKGQVGLLLSKKETFSTVMSSDSIDQLFTVLSNIHAWDFLHPQLLEYLIQEVGDNEAKKSMEEYKLNLLLFRKTTKMSELSGWFGNISKTSVFQKIVLSLGDNWKDKTYEEFEVLRISLLRQQAFFQSSLSLCGVLTTSVLVALAIPKSIDVADIRRMLVERFLTENEISGIYAEGFCLIRDGYYQSHGVSIAMRLRQLGDELDQYYIMGD